MTDDATMELHFQSLRQVLSASIGKANAITIDVLTRRCEIPDRRTTEVVLETRLEDFGFALVSGSAGYYRPVSAEPLNRYLSSLESRIRCLSTRRSTVIRTALKEGFVYHANRFVDAPVQTELQLR